jgi:hypothetical protein
MAKLFAVYQFGWRDRTNATTPVGDGVTTPSWALIGVCRDAARADRRLRRAELGIG